MCLKGCAFCSVLGHPYPAPQLFYRIGEWSSPFFQAALLQPTPLQLHNSTFGALGFKDFTAPHSPSAICQGSTEGLPNYRQPMSVAPTAQISGFFFTLCLICRIQLLFKLPHMLTELVWPTSVGSLWERPNCSKQRWLHCTGVCKSDAT